MKKIFRPFASVFFAALLCAAFPASAHAAKISMKDADSKIILNYDDRHSFKSKVMKIKNISVKSFSVKSGKRDGEVLRLCEGSKKKVVACGCGKAVVVLKSGKKIGVKVKVAKISLLLLAGQSNMEGSHSGKSPKEDYMTENIINRQGKAYGTYGPSTVGHSLANGCFSQASPKLTIWNCANFVPESLAGDDGANEWERTDNLTDADGACGKTGLDGALADEWVKKTKEKVWVVNAAHSGSSIDTWVPGNGRHNNNFWQAAILYRKCEELLNKEIEAGHYRLSHKGYFWLQGETDRKMSASEYMKKFMKMHKGFMNELGAKGGSKNYKNVNKEMEFAGILMVRAHKIATDSSDLYMTGPRKAQYYMCNSSQKKFKKIYLASHIEEDWITDDGVASYFLRKYGSVQNFIALNNMRKKNVAMPSTVAEVHPTAHYTQLGYNELGRDAADNICYALNYASPRYEKAAMRLVGRDGYLDISSSVKARGDDMSLSVKVYPAYKAKSLDVMRTKGVALDRWNVKLRKENYFSGKVKYMVDGSTRIYTIYSQAGASNIEKIEKVPEGVKITWKKVDMASRYKVFRREYGSVKWTCIKKMKKKAVSCIDPFAASGISYEYMVKAFDKFGMKGKDSIALFAA